MQQTWPCSTAFARHFREDGPCFPHVVMCRWQEPVASPGPKIEEGKGGTKHGDVMRRMPSLSPEPSCCQQRRQPRATLLRTSLDGGSPCFRPPVLVACTILLIRSAYALLSASHYSSRFSAGPSSPCRKSVSPRASSLVVLPPLSPAVRSTTFHLAPTYY